MKESSEVIFKTWALETDFRNKKGFHLSWRQHMHGNFNKRQEKYYLEVKVKMSYHKFLRLNI